MQEVNDQRLRAVLQQARQRRPNSGFIQRNQDLSTGVNAFAHLEAQVAGNERLEASGEPPRLRPSAPAELEGVAKSPRGYQSTTRTLAFNGEGASDVDSHGQFRHCSPCRSDTGK
jgi:hypothetical protein